MFEWSSLGIEMGSRVTDSMIANVEATLGITFPQCYLDLVKYCDEATFEIGVFEYDGGATSISEFLKFTDVEAPYSILWYQQQKRIELPLNVIPIARDAGNYLICFDFNSLRPSVSLYNPNNGALHYIADSFEEFIADLEE